jgi:chemotaxis protein CheZ
MTAAAYSETPKQKIAEISSERSETIEVSLIADVVHSLLNTVDGDISATDLRLHDEIVELVEFVRRAHVEIVALDPKAIRSEQITTANQELDAVVAATEEATGTILDAAEQIESIADELDAAHGDRLREITMSIFEASKFQDITGQRITKALTALNHIEQKVEVLAAIVAGEQISETEAPAHGEEPSDEDLLNGPSMPDAANSQEDIDALLASFD